MGVLIVTGAGSSVGKTVAAAAITACAAGDVAVVKLAQTGLAPDAPGDVGELTRLTRREHVYEFARYPDALPPHHAAMIAGLPPLRLADTVRRIVDLDALHDLVVVEGAGGLLAPFDAGDRWTLVDLAHAVDARFAVVSAVDPDMVSHSALVIDTLREHGLDVAAVLLGSWPAVPDLAARYGVFDLQAMAPGRELAGVLPAGIAMGGGFRSRARAALARTWRGTLDTRAFVTRQQP